MVETHILQLAQEGEPTGGRSFLDEGLRRGDTVVIVGRPERWRAHAGVRGGDIQLVDARTLLGADSLAEALATLVREARASPGGVRIYSELTDILWHRGERARALAVERAWNGLGAAGPFSVMCACEVDALDGHAYEGALQALSALHVDLVPVGDWGDFDNAVGRAVTEVLEPGLVRMLHTLSAASRPARHVPTGVALLFWLKENMPRTAEKVLARSRARWTAH